MGKKSAPTSKKGQKRWTRLIDWTGGMPTPIAGSEERQGQSVIPSATGETVEAAPPTDVERLRQAFASRKKLRMGISHG